MVILAMTFTTIASAIGAGSGSARETRNQVMATLAAEEMLSEILSEPWDRLPDWNGYRETTGDSRAPDGRIEKDRAELLRVVSVMDESRHLEPIGVDIEGRRISDGLLRIMEPFRSGSLLSTRMNTLNASNDMRPS